MLGRHFEREIREQPDVWRRLARGDAAQRLARALGDDEVVLVGSGSSLNAAALGALALRRHGRRAQALAATEAHLDHRTYEKKTVVAVSQSGRSADLLAAIDVLRPKTLIALTNSNGSPLARRARTVVDVEAGPESAVPASKSVSATVAILLHAASLLEGSTTRNAAVLIEAADAVDAWFVSPEYQTLVEVAHEIAKRRSTLFLGTDYGFPIAREAALKLKEASYLHAEGFAAGEFRHGSIAMVDDSVCVVGIADDDGLAIVERPLRELRSSGALRVTIGCEIDGMTPVGPRVFDPFNTLAWLVAIQSIALHAARVRNVDSDAPRGLRKALGE